MSEEKHSRSDSARRAHCGNPVARSPLLRKGGAHERSTGGKRHLARLSTYDAIEEWLEMQEAEAPEVREKGSGSAPFFMSAVDAFRQRHPETLFTSGVSAR
jgi:hypothetical protein